VDELAPVGGGLLMTGLNSSLAALEDFGEEDEKEG